MNHKSITSKAIPSVSKDELQKQQDHRKSLWTFVLWMIFCSFVFGGASAFILYLYEVELRPSGRQAELLGNWAMTLTIGYAYARMLMHVATHRLLTQHSKSFNFLPGPIQDDCVFIVIDSLSAFFWNPLVIYTCYHVFSMSEMDIFFQDFEPLAKVALTMFQVDRAMQLIVHFRSERLIHHVMTSSWALLVMEWTYSLRDPGVFVTGAIMEGLAKFSWYFHFIARMNRAFIRNQPNGEWNAESIVGADVLFVSKTARKQTRFMQFGYCVFLFAHLVAPFALVGVYLLGTMGDSVSLVWKIALPCIFAVFNLLDAGQYKSLSKQSKYSYWTETVFQKKNEEKDDTPAANGISQQESDMMMPFTSDLLVTTATPSTSLSSINV